MNNSSNESSAGPDRRFVSSPPPRRSRRALAALPAAALSVALAAGSMSLLDLVASAIGPLPPFLFAFPAVILAALVAGFLPALATAVLCIAWLQMPWIERTPLASIESTPYSWALFVATSALMAAAVTRYRRPLPDGDLQADPSSSERWLFWLLGLAVVLPVLLYAALGAYALREAHWEAEQRIERIARVAQEHVDKVLDTNEMLLGRVLDLVEGLTDQEIRDREAVLHDRLKAMTAGLPQLQSLWVENVAGRPVLTNRFLPAPTDRLDVSDRDFFLWHRMGRGGLFISEPSVGRITKEAFFDTSRRRNDVRGEFAGIVHASLRPGYFTRFFAELVGAEPTLVVTLFRTDGVLLARLPAPPSGTMRSDPESELMLRISQGAKAGIVVMPSSFDGRERLVAFRALSGYPLFVGAGVESASVMASWRKDMVALAGLLFPISAALIAMAWVALQRARRERVALVQVRAEIDQRLKAESALLRNQKLQALGQITGSVAHDFNNLLAVVSNCAHLIMHRPAGTDARPQAEAIERAVRTGVHLTRQLLAFSRRQALQPVETDLRVMLARTRDLLRTSVSGRVVVEMEVAPDLSFVRIDTADLELALLNLVLNARDAMPEGGTVRIVARNVDEAPPRAGRGEPEGATGHGWVEIRVIDTGTGIAPQLLERVFEPFFTTKDETNGTGLGLSQVRAACEQAGGSVTIGSALGVGTTISLRLPAIAPHALPSDPVITNARVECSLLLVEDDPEVASTTAALLEAAGATVERAASAAAALELLEAAPDRFDLVLSDVAMPGPMNGLGLAQRLRRMRPRLPVVLMTGFTNELEIAIADGFSVVAKPFHPHLLLRALATACERSDRRARTSDRGEPARLA